MRTTPVLDIARAAQNAADLNVRLASRVPQGPRASDPRAGKLRRAGQALEVTVAVLQL